MPREQRKSRRRGGARVAETAEAQPPGSSVPPTPQGRAALVGGAGQEALGNSSMARRFDAHLHTAQFLGREVTNQLILEVIIAK